MLGSLPEDRQHTESDYGETRPSLDSLSLADVQSVVSAPVRLHAFPQRRANMSCRLWNAQRQCGGTPRSWPFTDVHKVSAH